jgi:hypothetical protein
MIKKKSLSRLDVGLVKSVNGCKINTKICGRLQWQEKLWMR